MSTDINPAVVLKLSSGLIMRGPEFLKNLAEIVVRYRHKYHFAIVSSGAIALAMNFPENRLTKRPTSPHELMDLAQDGQPELMKMWQEAFKEAGAKFRVGQALYTHNDLGRSHPEDIGKALAVAFRRGKVVVINENDAVSYREISFGDNDQLAARLSFLLGAQKLILMTNTVPGLLDAKGNLIERVEGMDDQLFALAGGSGEATSVGGMRSKYLAAQLGTLSSPTAESVIMGGEECLGRLDRYLRGHGPAQGTTFVRGRGSEVLYGIVTKTFGVPHQLCDSVQVSKEATWGADRFVN